MDEAGGALSCMARPQTATLVRCKSLDYSKERNRTQCKCSQWYIRQKPPHLPQIHFAIRIFLFLLCLWPSSPLIYYSSGAIWAPQFLFFSPFGGKMHTSVISTHNESVISNVALSPFLFSSHPHQRK